MNIEIIDSLLNSTAMKSVLLFGYLGVAVLLTGYNWFYLYHGVRKGDRGFGQVTPLFIRNLVRFSVLLSLVTVLAAIVVFVAWRVLL